MNKENVKNYKKPEIQGFGGGGGGGSSSSSNCPWYSPYRITGCGNPKARNCTGYKYK